MHRARMHTRNIFKRPPDFTELAIKYAEFRAVCKLELSGRVDVDYKNKRTLEALTRSLLKEYYKLDVDFAPGSLIPTLPLRLNYILWIEDLMEKVKHQESKIIGIDIGCGSSCIYALLAAKKYDWHMCALETNAKNIEFAEKNVMQNNLNNFITIYRQTNKDVIFKDFLTQQSASAETTTFSFCMCNPPFYDRTLNNPFNNTTRNVDKRRPPRNCPTGNAEELMCDGGEVQFVRRLIEESVIFDKKIRIFTTMLGCKSSLAKIKKLLLENQIKNFCTTEFCQGKTVRWGIAWSYFEDIQLNEAISQQKQKQKEKQ